MLQGLETTSKKAVCLGDMLELGENEAMFHASIADSIDFGTFDHVLLFGQLMKNLYENIVSQQKNSEWFDDRDQLLERLKQIMNEETVILFKASNGLRFMDLIKQLEEYYEH